MNKKRILNHLGNVAITLVSVSLMSTPALALEPADTAVQVIGLEGAKEALNAALRVARSKPALSVSTTITCIACVPVAGVVASPGLFIACGILVAKTFG